MIGQDLRSALKFASFFILLVLSHTSRAQLPGGAIWGCPSIPMQDIFDTTCFQRTSEIKLGQGYFDHFTASDPVYLVVPQNRPSYAISMAIGWNYYRNVLGHNKMSINQWFATMGQENGFAAFNGVQLPATIYDVEVGGNIALPCLYPRGCNSNACAGAGYCWHVSQNGNDGPYHNTLAGYQTVSPYVPVRFPGPASTYHPLYNSSMEMATMAKTFYDLSIYRRAQFMNNADIAPLEVADPYGVEAAQAVAYNMGPNSPQAISVAGWTPPGGMAANTFWAGSYFNGGVSCYAQRVASMTAVLDNNETYAKTLYPGACGGNANNWDFYSFYDSQIKWDTVLASVNRLLVMYPEINLVPAAKAAYIAKVQTAFNRADADANTFISFRYEMGGVIDAIVMNLPKDDPGFNAQYAINGTGCKLDCRAPYATIKPLGPTTICPGQTAILKADVDAPTGSTTYQWQLNGVNIGGATTDLYNATVAGTYSVIVCWSTVRESNGAAVTCCSQPQCQVTVTASATCNTCGMGLTLTPTSNSCTGMANGSIQATVSGVAGPFNYIVTGAIPYSYASTTFNAQPSPRNFTGLRDGKYTIQVIQQSNPTCKAVQDVFITPTTVIKESLTATVAPAPCASQLNAILINQQPNTCPITVSYGSLNVASWDRSFIMDLKTNGTSSLTMFESYPSAGTRDDPWDWWPFSWPAGGAGNAPNVKTITVKDGDTLSAFGITLVPQGTPVPGFIDGGVRLDGATFTNLNTSANSSSAIWRYRGDPPVAPWSTPINGSRPMPSGSVATSYRVTCPVTAPPVYTYSWSPSAGLTNPNIANPIASVSTNTTFTVTATHPTNSSCQLTASVLVPANCVSAPVDFVEFKAEVQHTVVQLQWIVANEKDCRNYQVMRSADGVHFESLGTLACRNTQGLLTYGFTDANPLNGVSYYRLLQEDLDGTQHYSSVRMVRLNDVAIAIQPNPFQHETLVRIAGEIEDPLQVQLTDVSGKVLWHKEVVHAEDISVGKEWSAGVYILLVKYNNKTESYKLVKW